MKTTVSSRGLRLATAFTLAAALTSGRLAAQTAPASAATTPSTTEEFGDVLLLNAFVVTGVARPGETKLKSSVSLSSIAADQLETSVPRSTPELFRSIPGIRAEATSGESNANITVRGAPISAGGSRYLQLQEDGLPVLQFGDIAFATADSFLRIDGTIARVEAIRGGSASTFASNSPGGIINLISKTGEETGGSLTFAQGLDYESSRVDLDYGRPLGENLRFHVGGFFRTGEGPRHAGYNANSGGQLKMNLTRTFDRGYVRLYLKHLDDSTITYLPIPMRVAGTNADPSFGSIANFDRLTDTLNSPYFRSALGLDGGGSPTRSAVDEGVRVESTAFGAEASFELGGGWTLTERFRVSNQKGAFVAPFPAEVSGARELATAIGGAGAGLRYANGPLSGQTVANPDTLNGNGLLARVHLFNTDLNRFNLLSNDVRLNKLFELENGSRIDATAGLYTSRQSVDMDWLWNTYLMEVRRDAALVDVVAADGTFVTENGLVAYGVPYWGNLHRRYDVDYDTRAPFVSIAAEIGRLNLDASVRFDRNEARGSTAGNIQRANVDLNGDGIISNPERSVSAVNTGAPSPVRYDVSFTGFSLGANYAFSRSLAVFGRYSEGASASADRILFGSAVRPDGSIVGDKASYNRLDQFEGGVKYQTQTFLPGTLGLFATYFHAETTESNYELTNQRFTDRVYVADGLELEAVYAQGGFELRVGATLTDAQIDKAESATLVGKTPRRQADLTYQIAPSYQRGRWTVGGSVLGTTKAYAQDDNQLVFPAYAYVNAFASYAVTERVGLSVQANNLFDTFGLSEAEEGAIPASGIVRARGLSGRTVSASIRYTF